jgi:hypothetical protein
LARIPNHDDALGVDSKASTAEIERGYQHRIKELRRSRASDGPEELAEVGSFLLWLVRSRDLRFRV